MGQLLIYQSKFTKVKLTFNFCIVSAYYHVSLHKSARKYTRFIIDGTCYKYTGLPMGLTCSPPYIYSDNQACHKLAAQEGGTTCYLHLCELTFLFLLMLKNLILGYFSAGFHNR